MKRSIGRGTPVLAIALGLALAGPVGCSRGEERSQPGAAASAAAPPSPVASKKGAAAGNRPPQALLEIAPLVGLSGLTGIDLDGTYSTDDASLPSELMRRWDYDGDGRWDTGLTRSSRTTHVYEASGRYRPRLLVVDGSGLADSVVGPEIEIRSPCPVPDFALLDINPNSRSFQRTVRLSELRGLPVLAWFVAPSK